MEAVTGDKTSQQLPENIIITYLGCILAESGGRDEEPGGPAAVREWYNYLGCILAESVGREEGQDELAAA